MQRETCEAQGVRGYPTLQLFKGGSAEGIKYQGNREKDSLVAFINEHKE